MSFKGFKSIIKEHLTRLYPENMINTELWQWCYKNITEGKKRTPCIIQLYLIWDQLLSPLPLLVSRQPNGTCQNKGSEIRLEQSWAGHLGGRLSISHSACCLERSHSCTHTSLLTNCVCVWHLPPSLRHVIRILQRRGYTTWAALPLTHKCPNRIPVSTIFFTQWNIYRNKSNVDY